MKYVLLLSMAFVLGCTATSPSSRKPAVMGAPLAPVKPAPAATPGVRPIVKPIVNPSATPTPAQWKAPLAAGPLVVPQQDGVFECFPEGSTFAEKNKEGVEEKKPYTCEPSAVYASGVSAAHFFVLNDKPIDLPGYSQHFEVKLGIEGRNSTVGHGSAAIQGVKKFEAVALTLDQQWVIASAAFDREKEGYNGLLTWRLGQEAAAHALEAPRGFASVREWIGKAVGTPYFKIEGLAVIPGNRFLLGVRETGRTYQDFNYGITVISASFKLGANGPSLEGDAKTLFSRSYAWSPQETPGAELGISSLEYDFALNRVIALASVEPKQTKDSPGAQSVDELQSVMLFWNLQDLEAGAEPKLAVDSAGKPLDLGMKAEGLTSFGVGGKVLVVFDNDRLNGVSKRYTGTVRDRKLHQGIYRIYSIR